MANSLNTTDAPSATPASERGSRRSGRGSVRDRGRSGRARRRPANAGDPDGDTSMGAADTPPVKRFNPYRAPRAPAAAPGPAPPAADSSDVTIRGYKGGTQEELVHFIQARARPPVQVLDSRTYRDSVFLTLAGHSQALAVLKLSGVQFKGRPLTIHPARPSRSSTTASKFPAAAKATPVTSVAAAVKDSVVEQLRALVKERYRPENKLLDLSDLDATTHLRREAMRSGPASKKSNFWPAVLKMARDQLPEIVSISLARNELVALDAVALIGRFFPELRNLSLADNAVATFRDLDYLARSTEPPRKLRELVLTGNPLRENERRRTSDDTLFVRAIANRFPSLRLLDGVPLPDDVVTRSPAAPASAPATAPLAPFPTLPVPVRQSFFDGDASMTLANQFLAAYFERYDTRRPELADWYDPGAIFTLFFNPAPPVNVTHPVPPPVAYLQAFQATSLGRKLTAKATDPASAFHPRVHKAQWTDYLSRSRNLTRLRDTPETAARRLHVGPDAILAALVRFPASIHPLEDGRRFSVYAWPLANLPPSAYPGPGPTPAAADLPPAVMIAVSGEFYQPSDHSLRSFDRTFILAPALPGSRAQAAGCPFSIRNDVLTLRHYAGSEGWDATRYPAPAVAAIPGALSPTQAQAVEQLHQRMGLTPADATQCLQQHAWDIERAAAAVQQMRTAGTCHM